MMPEKNTRTSFCYLLTPNSLLCVVCVSIKAKVDKLCSQCMRSYANVVVDICSKAILPFIISISMQYHTCLYIPLLVCINFPSELEHVLANSSSARV